MLRRRSDLSSDVFANTRARVRTQFLHFVKADIVINGIEKQTIRDHLVMHSARLDVLWARSQPAVLATGAKVKARRRGRTGAKVKTTARRRRKKKEEEGRRRMKEGRR